MLNFHITYTGGTVKTTTIFLHSLVKDENVRYSLVANGCSRSERTWLERLCHHYPQCDLVILPWPDIVAHGVALNHLLSHSAGDHFSFMDSDIFALGEFSTRLEENLAGGTALFSCMPALVGHQAAPSTPPTSYHGNMWQTADGTVIGVTYLAIYERAALAACAERFALGFQPYLWDALPPAAQKVMEDRGMRGQSYDTGKALNIVLGSEGRALRYCPLPELRHLGNLSWATNATQVASARQGLARFRTNTRNWGWQREVTRALRNVLKRLLNRRDPHIGDYFRVALRELAAGRPAPPLPARFAGERGEAVRQLMQEITQLFADYHTLHESIGAGHD
jgi:hypothetical protein